MDLILEPSKTTVIKPRYTNKFIRDIPIIKSDKNKINRGTEKAILLSLKLSPLNNAIAVTGEKFGG